jgi:anti-sigma B factor antagonist
VSTNGGPGEFVVAVTGDLDVATVPDWSDRLARLLDASDGDFVLDLEQVTFADSTAVLLLLQLRGRVETEGRRLIFRHTPKSVDRVLQLLGLTDLFTFDD